VCSSPFSSTFLLPNGPHTFTVNAQDPAGNTGPDAIFAWRVDTTAPALQLPAPITASATSPAGAVVTYSVSATDPDDAANTLSVSCTPASGASFPIATTTVNCTAKDPVGNNSTGSFTVMVKGAAAQLSDLVTLVNSMGLHQPHPGPVGEDADDGPGH
jgi:hypothetical protein